MKVKIENSLNELGLMPELHSLINAALTSSSLDKFIENSKEISYNNNLFTIGRGGSHAYVSLKNKRILLITE